MGNIGAEIFGGIMGALWHALGLVPFGAWVALLAAVLIVVFMLRYATNWKVDLFAIVAFFIISEVLVYRAHWIDLGYEKAQAEVKAAQVQMKAYQRTEGLIQACYAKNVNATYLWDRTQGKCLSASGAIGN